MRAQRRLNRLCVPVAVAERRPLESRAIRMGFLWPAPAVRRLWPTLHGWFSVNLRSDSLVREL
jgi:hypothetical protein